MLAARWVDVSQFLRDARGVGDAAGAGRHFRAVHLALAAERLHRDDFHAYDDHSGWATTHRDRLTQTRQAMLCRAAESAIELGRFRDALDFAGKAVRLDRLSETAHRSLMRAFAELGELGNALRVFDSFRAHLAEELGIDPSAQTRALHVDLLRRNSS